MQNIGILKSRLPCFYPNVSVGEVNTIQDSFEVLEREQGRHEHAGAVTLVELDQGASG